MTSATLSSWKERSRTSSLAAATILARPPGAALAGGAVAFVGVILLHSVTHRVMDSPHGQEGRNRRRRSRSRIGIAVMGLLAVVSVANVPGAAASSGGGRMASPNILVVMTDDIAASDLPVPCQTSGSCS